MDDAMMEAIEPYNMDDAIPFGSAYLTGYLADKYDVDEKASRPRAGERVKASMNMFLRGSVEGYSTVTTASSGCSTKNGKAKYALLPVWLLNTKWKDKIYTFAMNGQTGKFIGNLPCDKGKFWRMLLLIAAAVAVPVAALLILLM